MTEHAVVIAGGGPAGRMLAAELALASVVSHLTSKAAHAGVVLHLRVRSERDDRASHEQR